MRKQEVLDPPTNGSNEGNVATISSSAPIGRQAGLTGGIQVEKYAQLQKSGEAQAAGEEGKANEDRLREDQTDSSALVSPKVNVGRKRDNHTDHP
jgi:hypothetical protein